MTESYQPNEEYINMSNCNFVNYRTNMISPETDSDNTIFKDDNNSALYVPMFNPIQEINESTLFVYDELHMNRQNKKLKK